MDFDALSRDFAAIRAWTDRLRAAERLWVRIHITPIQAEITALQEALAQQMAKEINYDWKVFDAQWHDGTISDEQKEIMYAVFYDVRRICQDHINAR